MQQKNFKNNQHLVAILFVIYYYEIKVFLKLSNAIVKKKIFIYIIFY